MCVILPIKDYGKLSPNSAIFSTALLLKEGRAVDFYCALNFKTMEIKSFSRRTLHLITNLFLVIICISGCKDGQSVPDEIITMTGIQVTPESLTFAWEDLSKSQQLTAKAIPESITGVAFTWSSSNKNVATVSSGGLVTATGAGSTTIFVSAGNVFQSASVTVQGPAPEEPDEPYEPNGFPILAWDEGYPGDHLMTVQRYRIMKEAGVNLSYVRKMTQVYQVEMALDAAHMAGLKIFVHCPQLETDTENVVARFKDHPALYGWNIADEPTLSRAPELVALGNKINALDGTHPVYINYYPWSGAEDVTYIQMINAFAPPLSFLSFDHYCIVVSTPGGPRQLYPYYYYNLEAISSEAKKLGIPFWSFALTAAHWNYPKPTLSDLRFQVYSILAYGAQGLQFFNWENENYIDFTSAPINHLTQQTTDVYDLVKQITQEVRALTDVFLGAQMIWVRHTGSSRPTGTTPLSTWPAPTNSYITSFSATGSGAVVSYLEKGNYQYILIVNRDLNNTSTMSVMVSSAVMRILKNGEAVSPGTNTQNISVEPGDALIYRWEK